ncbi:MAG: 5'-nucleotidase, partial [Methanomicrobiales archaeon]
MESAIRDLLVDYQRSIMDTDVAFISTGTQRADLNQVNTTCGDHFMIQPFLGTVVSIEPTCQQIRDVLERQWQESLPPHPLAVSGTTYILDAAQPDGSGVQEIRVGGVPFDSAATYTAAMMDYLFIGGDDYLVFTNGSHITKVPSDVDTLAS